MKKQTVSGAVSLGDLAALFLVARLNATSGLHHTVDADATMIVQGTELDGVRVPAAGSAQFASVLLEEGAGYSPLLVLEAVMEDDVCGLSVLQTELAFLGGVASPAWLCCFPLLA